MEKVEVVEVCVSVVEKGEVVEVVVCVSVVVVVGGGGKSPLVYA